MPGPVALRASLRPLAFAAMALPILFYCACGSDPGTTPACISDVTANGIVPTDGGCSGFAVCQDGMGNVIDPHICCDMKDPGQQNACLFLYGAGPAPNNSGSGSGGGSSSSSSGMDAGNNG